MECQLPAGSRVVPKPTMGEPLRVLSHVWPARFRRPLLLLPLSRRWLTRSPSGEATMMTAASATARRMPPRASGRPVEAGGRSLARAPTSRPRHPAAAASCASAAGPYPESVPGAAAVHRSLVLICPAGLGRLRRIEVLLGRMPCLLGCCPVPGRLGCGLLAGPVLVPGLRQLSLEVGDAPAGTRGPAAGLLSGRGSPLETPGGGGQLGLGAADGLRPGLSRRDPRSGRLLLRGLLLCPLSRLHPGLPWRGLLGCRRHTLPGRLGRCGRAWGEHGEHRPRGRGAGHRLGEVDLAEPGVAQRPGQVPGRDRLGGLLAGERRDERAPDLL